MERRILAIKAKDTMTVDLHGLPGFQREAGVGMSNPPSFHARESDVDSGSEFGDTSRSITVQEHVRIIAPGDCSSTGAITTCATIIRAPRHQP